MLAGLLRTLGAALQRQPKWKPGVQPVVRMVLEQFLFDLPTLHDAPPFLPPKAKTRLVRNCCYDLLIEMVSAQVPSPRGPCIYFALASFSPQTSYLNLCSLTEWKLLISYCTK